MQHSHHTHIILDHGTGARLSHDLIDTIVKTLGEANAGIMEDSAILPVGADKIAMTTDSFVVDPVIFGNGDIGKISVCGTVNDLAMSGATPHYLTLGLVLEEGLEFATLRHIIASISKTALEAGVKIVAGDTKVVKKGECDKIFINTAGVGLLNRPPLRMADVKPGDKIILNGYIGNHAIHLLSIREGLGFEERVLSDCAPLNGLLKAALDTAGEAVHSARDVTRGGLAAVLQEYAGSLGRKIHIKHDDLPLQPEMLMAADMLGVDPLNLANEGCAALFVDPARADKVLETLKAHPFGEQAKIIGEVTDEPGDELVMTKDGETHVVEELQGAELPRLC